ncbi:hypothetical protein M0P25_04730 [archaeon]|nr:hypothetical protein [archaeon]MDD3940762.1 hypothetical protein [Candidatus Paceibacterota bacterium]
MKKNKIKQFLKSLENVPIIQKACKECGISRNTIYRWRENEEFKQMMDEAIIIGNKNIDDLTCIKYFSLINKEYWPAIKYRLMHSLGVKEKSLLEMLDLETKKQRDILNKWRENMKGKKKEKD